MNDFKRMPLIPKILTTGGVLAACTLIFNLYTSQKGTITTYCMPTSGQYTKDSPEAKQYQQQGFNKTENPNKTVSFWLPEVNPKEICAQEHVLGISTSSNPRVMEEIQGGLQGNLNDKQKEGERLRKAGELVTKRDAEIARFRKENETKAKRLDQLESQIKGLTSNKDPKKLEPKKK